MDELMRRWMEGWMEDGQQVAGKGQSDDGEIVHWGMAGEGKRLNDGGKTG